MSNLVQIARRAQEFTSFIVMEILERAVSLEKKGRSIIHLEIGEPGFQPPQVAVEAVASAAREGKTYYTPSLGVPELRQAISNYYKTKYGIEVPAHRIIVTTGSTAGFILAMAAVVERGDGIAVPDPGYPCYPNFARLFEARPVPIPAGPETGFELSVDLLEKTDLSGVKLFIISSPANPTGAITPKSVYKWILDKGFLLISDEIYHGLVEDDVEEFTALQLSDQVIVVDGFSKRFSMTGFRLGWMVVPEWMVDSVHKLAQSLYISPPTLSQWAGLAALNEGLEAVEEYRKQLCTNRRLLLGGLKELGFSIPYEPKGAFYLFVDISKFSDDSYQFCLDLLDKAGVAVTPGVDFGKNKTSNFVRFSYARPMSEITEALNRIETFIKQLG